MAVTRGGTLSNATRTVTGTDASITHTVDANTTLLVISVFFEAGETVSGTPQWSLGGGENFTLIDATTSSGSNNDMACATYGLVSPTSGAGTVTITVSSNDNSISTATNYIGTNTSATMSENASLLQEDVNDSATNTTVFSSAGTAGNCLYAAGCFKGDDGTGVTVPTGFFEIFDAESGGGSSNADIAAYVCDELDGAPSACTWTWAASDENAGHYIEVFKPLHTSSGTPSITKPTSSGSSKIIKKASGTPSITKPTSSGSAFIWPRVYLNTTETKTGADEMTVTAANAAGTSITFTDPSGGKTGSLKLGVENALDLLGWIDVTVNSAGGGITVPLAFDHLAMGHQ